MLIDGFNVASVLRERHPEAYDILTRVNVQGHAAGEESLFYESYPSSGYPILSVDEFTQELTQTRWRNDNRSVMRHISPSDLEAWYVAIGLWHGLLTSPENEFWVQLEPGTVVVADNYRILHGRKAFTGKRRMCGAYIGGDDYRSRLSSLKEKYEGERRSRSVWHPRL